MVGGYNFKNIGNLGVWDDKDLTNYNISNK